MDWGESSGVPVQVEGGSCMVRSKLNKFEYLSGICSLCSEIQYIIENGPMRPPVNTQNDR